MKYYQQNLAKLAKTITSEEKKIKRECKSFIFTYFLCLKKEK